MYELLYIVKHIIIHVSLIVSWTKPKLYGGRSPNHFGPMDPGILGISRKLLSHVVLRPKCRNIGKREKCLSSSYLELLIKTYKSKRRIVCFGGKVLIDKKMPPPFLRSIFILTHHFLYFCLFFLSVQVDLVRKCCGRRLGGQFGQFIAKSPL